MGAGPMKLSKNPVVLNVNLKCQCEVMKYIIFKKLVSYSTERPRKMASLVAVSTPCAKPVVVKYHSSYLSGTRVLRKNGIGNE